MRVALLVMCLGSLLADDLEVHNGVDTVPTSNWAEVYLGDSTDYREPVREESPFPVVEAASRSDWFHSYPYQKFEERKEEEPGIFESLGNSMKDSVDTIGNTVKDSVDTIGNTVKDSVGTVRNNFVGVGEGVVNGALRLVGAETLREKQAKAKAREGKPDPLIDFSLDISYGFPGIGRQRYSLGSLTDEFNILSCHDTQV